MKEIIGMLAAVLALTVLAVNVLAATSTASVTVPASCGLAATNIDFTSLAPGTTSSDVTSTVSMPSGNTPEIPTIQGTDWCTGTFSGSTCGTPPTPLISAGQTHWYMTDVAYGSMTALTTSGVSIEQSVGFGSPKTVHFKLAIPAGQTAASYTQTITFTATC